MRKIIGSISLWSPVFFLLLICGEVALRYPCNHGAGFYRYLYPLCGLLVFSGVNGFILKESKIKESKIGFYLVALCLLLILVSDAFNIYIDYDVWTSRGMPHWGHPAFVIDKWEVGCETK